LVEGFAFVDQFVDASIDEHAPVKVHFVRVWFGVAANIGGAVFS
jgi:hypothetical protein